MRIRAFAGAIFAIASSLIISLVLSEAIVRALAPPWLEQRMSILAPITGGGSGFGTDHNWKVERKNGKFLSFTPNSKFDVSHVEFHNVAHIDDLGGRRTFRSGNGASKRIVALGDSFAFGVGVEDQETFVSQIAEKLANVGFLNLGVPGSALPQQLAILRERHVELASEMYVFFFFLGNDFDDIIRDEEAGRRRDAARAEDRSEGDPSNGFLWRVNDLVYHNSVLKRSYLIQFLRKLSLDVLNAGSSGVVPRRDPVLLIMDKSMVEYRDKAMSSLARHLRALVDEQARLGFRSLLVAVPDKNQLNAAFREYQAQIHSIPPASLEPFRPNQLLSIATSDAGVGLIDPTECILSAGYKSELLYYHHDNHFRALGHQVLASCVVDRLASAFSLPRER